MDTISAAQKYEDELDALRDIIWWIKGYRAANDVDCPFDSEHVEALLTATNVLQQQ